MDEKKLLDKLDLLDEKIDEFETKTKNLENSQIIKDITKVVRLYNNKKGK